MGWLQQCLDTHRSCNEARNQSPWYPTRLLDVGDVTAESSDVRLILSASETLIGPYCTLSHCWGHSRFIQLNRDTERSLRSGVSLEQMPKTFREAVLATKRLGIRYIWIDSLCIAQDNLSDWSREAASMHKVYSNTYCNLSASASADSSEGLYRQRQPHTFHPTLVNLCVEGLSSEDSYVRCEVHDRSFWERKVSECVLNGRGWVSHY